MKLSTIIILSVSAFCYITSFAQTQSLPFIMQNSGFKPTIKINNDHIFINHYNGIYTCDINKLDKSEYSWQQIFAGNMINDFIINENKILAIADNYLNDEVLILKSNDYGETISASYPQEMGEKIRDFKYSSLLCNNPATPNEVIAMTHCGVYKSSDFGETWSKINNSERGISIAYHPFCSDYVIMGFETYDDFYDNDKFYIFRNNDFSIESATEISWFAKASGIAFHPTDTNTIILAGTNIAKTNDNGQTWTMTREVSGLNIDDFVYPYKISFDLRGSNRLYGSGNSNKLYYSDDFGATWSVLFEIFDNVNVADFVQYKNKIYCVSTSLKLMELNLDDVDTPVSEITYQQHIKINSSNNKIIFKSDYNIISIELFDSKGNKILSHELNSYTGNIDISALSAGVHIAVFTTSDGQTISKKIHITP